MSKIKTMFWLATSR